MANVVLLHDVDGAKTSGVADVARRLLEASHRVLQPTSRSGWWPCGSLNEWVSNQASIEPSERCIGIGIGSGGQSLLRAAFAEPRRWGAVATIAPACDLGRWYGRGTELDELYRSADEARQDEAPLHFNPLSRPPHQLCWCDPRDDACAPSALRVVSKLESSGVPITADLTSRLGTDRDGYVMSRSEELVSWVDDVARRMPVGPDLPVV